MKTLGRIILILLMIPAGLQSFVALLGVFAAATQKPEAFSYMIGRFVGSLLFLMLFVWMFRKLGEKSPDDH